MQQPITRQRIEELQRQKNPVVLIDIRTPEEYENGHVPGAVNIPAETIVGNTSNLAVNDTIVCICNKGYERSQNAAETFTAMGFTRVFYLKEGTAGWQAE